MHREDRPRAASTGAAHRTVSGPLSGPLSGPPPKRRPRARLLRYLGARPSSTTALTQRIALFASKMSVSSLRVVRSDDSMSTHTVRPGCGASAHARDTGRARARVRVGKISRERCATVAHRRPRRVTRGSSVAQRRSRTRPGAQAAAPVITVITRAGLMLADPAQGGGWWAAAGRDSVLVAGGVWRAPQCC